MLMAIITVLLILKTLEQRAVSRRGVDGLKVQSLIDHEHDQSSAGVYP